MFKFYCSSCGKRNSYESKSNQPKFCCHCGHPRNGVVASDPLDDEEVAGNEIIKEDKAAAIQRGRQIARSLISKKLLDVEVNSSDA